MSQAKSTLGVCQEDGCQKPAKTRGLCDTHYQRLWRSENHERQLENERKWRDKNREKVRDYHRQRYVENREKVLQREAERYRTDPEFRKLKSDRAKKWAKDNPEQARERRRESWLRRKYGLTPEEWEAILAKGCAICGTHAGRVTGGRGKHLTGTPQPRLCIDHDHANGKVRDALCHSCNSGLGLFSDDAARLRAAAEYLERHR